uniref:Uncharacterized protein n=1 Tax=Rhizophagus irregularis (strain DAOM 181602 / DAOM 197198 / MUCL 43194) TaxID=747089 RepID=U9UMC8_RHIID
MTVRFDSSINCMALLISASYDSIIREEVNLKEVLTNYLFNHKNFCYVDEFTHKLIPINAYDKLVEK